MTLVTVDPSLQALVTQSRTLAELIVTVLLLAIVLEREMVRGRSPTSAWASGLALMAIAFPLTFVWLTVVIQRAMVFLSP